MTWSYNLSLLNQKGKDFVRYLIGDTVSSDPQLQDEEIAMSISMRSTAYGAAAECCRSLATKFSRLVDQAAGSSKITFSNMAKAYNARAIEFESLSTLSGAVTPYAGGISAADMLTQETNTDRVGPQFTIGMTDNYLPMAPTGPENEDSITKPGGLTDSP